MALLLCVTASFFGLKVNNVADSKLTSTSWVSGKDDKLITVDAYNAKPDTVITGVQDISKKPSEDTMSLLRGGKSMAKSVSAGIKLTAGAIKAFDKKTLLERATSFNGAIGSSLKLFSDKDATPILKSIKDTNQLFAKVGTLATKIKATDFQNANQLGKLINSYTKNNEFFKIEDLDAEVGLIAGIVNESTRYGLPNSLDKLTENITRGDVLKRIMDQVLPGAIQSGDARLLGQIAAKLGNKTAYELRPTVLRDFSRDYKRPANMTAEERQVLYQQLMASFSAVDNEWYITKRFEDHAGVEMEDPALDLTILAAASDDFKDIIAMGAINSTDPYEQLFGLSKIFKITTVDKQLAIDFPRTVRTSNTVSSKPASQSSF